MGANMARRLKDCGFHVTAVYDTNRVAATELASELGCAAAQDLSEVTAAADLIFTVVTDDNAMRQEKRLRIITQMPLIKNGLTIGRRVAGACHIGVSGRVVRAWRPFSCCMA